MPLERRPRAQPYEVAVTVNERSTLNVPEAAALLGIGLSKFWQMVQAGEVPSIRAGKRRLIPKAALDEWIHEEIARNRAAGQGR
jgi:excisionase family DNA binding protein